MSQYVSVYVIIFTKRFLKLQRNKSTINITFSVQTVRPYTPRHFPLPDEDYHEMMSSMPEGYRHSSPEPSPLPPPPVDDEETSSLSPMSPIIYDGDDPDDAEWDPHSDKTERRKNAFR